MTNKHSASCTGDPYWDEVKGALMSLIMLDHFAQVYFK